MVSGGKNWLNSKIFSDLFKKPSNLSDRRRDHLDRVAHPVRCARIRPLCPR
jgi:hypothetical protein